MGFLPIYTTNKLPTSALNLHLREKHPDEGGKNVKCQHLSRLNLWRQQGAKIMLWLYATVTTVKCPKVITEWLWFNQKGTFRSSSQKPMDLTDETNHKRVSWWCCTTCTHQLNYERGTVWGWRHGKLSPTATSCENIGNVTLQRFSGHADKKTHSSCTRRDRASVSLPCA